MKAMTATRINRITKVITIPAALLPPPDTPPVLPAASVSVLNLEKNSNKITM